MWETMWLCKPYPEQHRREIFSHLPDASREGGIELIW